MRFEPGEAKLVTLVDIAGNRVVSGGNRLASGPVDQKRLSEIIERIKSQGFAHNEQHEIYPLPAPFQMTRYSYAQAFGPTTGDRIR